MGRVTERAGAEPMTAILPCSCRHEYQDARYGAYRRAHNRTKQNKSREARGWRCTVCGHER